MPRQFSLHSIEYIARAIERGIERERGREGGRELTVSEAARDGDGLLSADLQRLGRGAGHKQAALRRSTGPEAAAGAAESGGEQRRGGASSRGGGGGAAEEDGHA